MSTTHDGHDDGAHDSPVEVQLGQAVGQVLDDGDLPGCPIMCLILKVLASRSPATRPLLWAVQVGIDMPHSEALEEHQQRTRLSTSVSGGGEVPASESDVLPFVAPGTRRSVWLTQLNGSGRALRSNPVLIVAMITVMALVAVMLSAWMALPWPVAAAATLAYFLVAVPVALGVSAASVIRLNSGTPGRYIWLGGRALATAREVTAERIQPDGRVAEERQWKVDNAHARPTGHGLAYPLLWHICHQADLLGRPIHTHANNLALHKGLYTYLGFTHEPRAWTRKRGVPQWVADREHRPIIHRNVGAAMLTPTQYEALRRRRKARKGRRHC